MMAGISDNDEDIDVDDIDQEEHEAVHAVDNDSPSEGSVVSEVDVKPDVPYSKADVVRLPPEDVTGSDQGIIRRDDLVKKSLSESEDPLQAEPQESLDPYVGMQIDRDSIADIEQLVCAEFFTGHVSKTPERYMKIRNHILSCWDKCQPNYLTKTAVRPGLRDCGDVNAIGRVHAFLEDIEAINAGCERRVTVRPAVHRTVHTYSSSPPSQWEANVEGARKRRVRNSDTGEWVNEKELEGRTVDHEAHITIVAVDRPKRRMRTTEYDPFRLLECAPSTAEEPPFAVCVKVEALLVMDTHAHLTSNEVIGLLGGVFRSDERTMEVQIAWPCNSNSTGLQCEMEPASEMEARSAFQQLNLDVVGWYHSHPAFAPLPSVRDMENQTSYQELFKRSDGVQPFVGMIVSPYDPQNSNLASDINVFFASDAHLPEYHCRQPISCHYTIVSQDIVNMQVVAQIAQLAVKYANYPQKVNLADSYGSSTRQQKLHSSLRHHLELSRVHPDSISAVLDALNTTLDTPTS